MGVILSSLGRVLGEPGEGNRTKTKIFDETRDALMRDTADQSVVVPGKWINMFQHPRHANDLSTTIGIHRATSFDEVSLGTTETSQGSSLDFPCFPVKKIAPHLIVNDLYRKDTGTTANAWLRGHSSILSPTPRDLGVVLSASENPVTPPRARVSEKIDRSVSRPMIQPLQHCCPEDDERELDRLRQMYDLRTWDMFLRITESRKNGTHNRYSAAAMARIDNFTPIPHFQQSEEQRDRRIAYSQPQPEHEMIFGDLD